MFKPLHSSVNGFYGFVLLPVGSWKGGLTVPARALGSRDKGTFVAARGSDRFNFIKLQSEPRGRAYREVTVNLARGP